MHRQLDKDETTGAIELRDVSIPAMAMLTFTGALIVCF